MEATATDVRNVDLADTLKGVSDERIDCILADEVPCYVNCVQWGTCCKLVEALVAAHLITVALRGSSSTSGPVVSESAGGLSRSYASPTSTSGSGFWMSTTFGQRYQELVRTRMTTPLALCDLPQPGETILAP